ncbi:MAG: acyl-CoA thioesterase II [Nocardioidaceae bacterium]
MTDLLALLELERLEVDLFRGRQPDTSFQRVFGGQVAAQALRATWHSVDDSLSVHSLHSYFLRPGDTSIPIVYDVERIRDGYSFATRRVVARQHGKPIYYLTASFQVDEPGFEHQDVMPAVPDPEACPLVGQLLRDITGREDAVDSWDREWAALDVRYAGDSRPGGELVDGIHPARTQIWFKVAGPVPADQPTNTSVLAYASDLTLLGVSLVPHGLIISSSEVQSASLDHSLWFHRPCRADSWMLYDQHSPSASGARGFAIGHVFSRTGTLIATVAQEGLIRPRGQARGALPQL